MTRLSYGHARQHMALQRSGVRPRHSPACVGHGQDIRFFTSHESTWIRFCSTPQVPQKAGHRLLLLAALVPAPDVIFVLSALRCPIPCTTTPCHLEAMYRGVQNFACPCSSEMVGQTASLTMPRGLRKRMPAIQDITVDSLLLGMSGKDD